MLRASLCVQCTAGIVELLEVAKSSVPPSYWTSTPVVLKATAGLRLLPGEKADQLLDRVRLTRHLISSLLFHVSVFKFFYLFRIVQTLYFIKIIQIFELIFSLIAVFIFLYF